MNDTKIYKSSLQGLIEEAKAPFYISNFRTETGTDFPVVTFTVTVAAFNTDGRICELVLAYGPVWLYDTEEIANKRTKIDDTEREVRARLAALNLEVRDGRISTTPVRGGVDG